MMKREIPFMPLEYVPTPGDREKRCPGFGCGRSDGGDRRNGHGTER